MPKRMMAFLMVIALGSASCGFLTPPASPHPSRDVPHPSHPTRRC